MGTDIKDSITTREKEILYLLSRGLNSKEIAAELFISAQPSSQVFVPRRRPTRHCPNPFRE